MSYHEGLKDYDVEQFGVRRNCRSVYTERRGAGVTPWRHDRAMCTEKKSDVNAR